MKSKLNLFSLLILILSLQFCFSYWFIRYSGKKYQKVFVQIIDDKSIFVTNFKDDDFIFNVNTEEDDNMRINSQMRVSTNSRNGLIPRIYKEDKQIYYVTFKDNEYNFLDKKISKKFKTKGTSIYMDLNKFVDDKILILSVENPKDETMLTVYDTTNEQSKSVTLSAHYDSCKGTLIKSQKKYLLVCSRITNNNLSIDYYLYSFEKNQYSAKIYEEKIKGGTETEIAMSPLKESFITCVRIKGEKYIKCQSVLIDNDSVSETEKIKEIKISESDDDIFQITKLNEREVLIQVGGKKKNLIRLYENLEIVGEVFSQSDEYSDNIFSLGNNIFYKVYQASNYQLGIYDYNLPKCEEINIKQDKDNSKIYLSEKIKDTLINIVPTRDISKSDISFYDASKTIDLSSDKNILSSSFSLETKHFLNIDIPYYTFKNKPTKDLEYFSNICYIKIPYCFNSCLTCDSIGNENNNKCTLCKNGYEFNSDKSKCNRSFTPPKEDPSKPIIPKEPTQPEEPIIPKEPTQKEEPYDPSLKECFTINKDDSNKCDECNTGYFVTSDFKCGKCPKNCRTCKDSKHCDICENDFVLKREYTLNEEDIECVNKCPNNIYIVYYDLNQKKDIIMCQSTCPKKFDFYDKTIKRCYDTSLLSKRIKDNSYKIILSIKGKSNSNMNEGDLIIMEIDKNNDKNYKLYFYKSSINENLKKDLSVLKSPEDKNLIFINNTCEQLIRDENHIKPNEDIFISQVSTLDLKDTYFMLFDEKGKQLTFKGEDECKKHFIIYSTPFNTEGKSYTLPYSYIIRNFNEKGINLFSEKDPVFFDICSSLSSEKYYDVPFVYRRERYLQRYTLCPTGCNPKVFSEVSSNIFCECSYKESDGMYNLKIGTYKSDNKVNVFEEPTYIFDCISSNISLSQMFSLNSSFFLIYLLIIIISQFVLMVGACLTINNAWKEAFSNSRDGDIQRVKSHEPIPLEEISDKKQKKKKKGSSVKLDEEEEPKEGNKKKGKKKKEKINL
ncbi:MAG: hypothetical protein MJ252_05865, partial [archaeon]|nr:hypothetical protein [archaeon]